MNADTRGRVEWAPCRRVGLARMVRVGVHFVFREGMERERVPGKAR